MNTIKRVPLKLLALLTIIILPNISFADSPLTSTPFFQKYTDVDIVLHAEQIGAMDPEIADYLHKADNPIDVKAAVINAIGWSKSGRKDAEQYVKLIFNSEVISPDELDENGHDAFVIGYLTAMDNYHNPENAVNYLKKAMVTLSNSYTVNIIYNLILAQMVMDKSFCEVWKYANSVFSNDKLDIDMRTNARNIIYDYLALYKSDCN